MGNSRHSWPSRPTLQWRGWVGAGGVRHATEGLRTGAVSPRAVGVDAADERKPFQHAARTAGLPATRSKHRPLPKWSHHSRPAACAPPRRRPAQHSHDELPEKLRHGCAAIRPARARKPCTLEEGGGLGTSRRCAGEMLPKTRRGGQERNGETAMGEPGAGAVLDLFEGSGGDEGTPPSTPKASSSVGCASDLEVESGLAVAIDAICQPALHHASVLCSKIALLPVPSGLPALTGNGTTWEVWFCGTRHLLRCHAKEPQPAALRRS